MVRSRNTLSEWPPCFLSPPSWPSASSPSSSFSLPPPAANAITTGAITLLATNQQPSTPPLSRSAKPTRPLASRTSASPPSLTWTPSLLTPPLSISSSPPPLQTTRSMIRSILDASKKASNVNHTNTARICLEILSYFDRHLSAAFSIALPASPLGDACAWANAALL